MANRVVVTGLGIVAPNGVGIPMFIEAIKNGRSGIKYHSQLQDLQFSCQIAGRPELSTELISSCFTELELRNFNSEGILYGIIAGIEAWKNAGLSLEREEDPDWDSGTIFGAGTSGIEKFREAIYKIDEKQVRKLGSNAVMQTMASGVSAYLGGKLGLGNQVSTNSSACTTGAESVLIAFERIQSGKAKRMLAGSTSDGGPYIWAGFDAMKVCTYKHNETPERGSRPMSLSASGFVPACGAGALLLESLDSAVERGAVIYAEVLGGHINSGGQRGTGTMTAPNSNAVQNCISSALKNTGLHADQIDVINGHLTATIMDSTEIRNWCTALGRSGEHFPYINALKGMTGHGLSASGSMECVASVLQIAEGFLFPNINCEDLHPDITAQIDPQKIPLHYHPHPIEYLAKASFGFGDVNACIIFKKYRS